MSGTVGPLASRAALAAIALLGWACAARADDKVSLLRGASGGNNGTLEVLTGGLALREGEVGGAFGTVQVGTGKRRFAYFAVVKHGLNADVGTSTSEKARVSRTAGECTQVVGVGDRKLTIVYQVKLNARKEVQKETLTVNGKEFDAAKGRVLVVDLTEKSPMCGQLKVALPADVPDVSEPKAAAALVKRTLAELAKKNKPIRAIIESAAH
ncbi:MAG TPA: hypothetical protein VFE78_33750 [Gemmataceae bacterium]|nr:hypothetical protein [Gemmataceae bacterium]